MRKRFNKMIAFLCNCALIFSVACNSYIGSPAKIAFYGINTPFENESGTCIFNLKKIIVADKLAFDGAIYEGKENILVINADVKFSKYALTKAGCLIKCFSDDYRNDYYINYKEDSQIKEIYSLLDTSGDFLLSLSQTINPKYCFSIDKQNFSGNIYLCFNLNDEIYQYLRAQSLAIINAPNFDIRLFIDDMTLEDYTTIEIGCYFSQVIFTEIYKII